MRGLEERVSASQRLGHDTCCDFFHQGSDMILLSRHFWKMYLLVFTVLSETYGRSHQSFAGFMLRVSNRYRRGYPIGHSSCSYEEGSRREQRFNVNLYLCYRFFSRFSLLKVIMLNRHAPRYVYTCNMQCQ